MPETPASVPPTPITTDDVAKVASLARLTLTDAELEAFTGQLRSILEHARDVEALDLADVPPTNHPYPLRNVFRPDEVTPGVDREEVLAQAPSAEAGMFRVPPVLGEAP
ncbi:Asp-tRNA(Asn)/Glu-tRNA(Gln) amidotransferase subunit GatC [Actinospongicola halichondriae]|uniref:Asp-tRNA(Asn)/Glu-tRNA(Gln) amidotransferase subunit GatC n=1 Tax=Actinospongicola halichondriae TaxID=3236844 RepID=UPI003D3BAB17